MEYWNGGMLGPGERGVHIFIFDCVHLLAS